MERKPRWFYACLCALLFALAEPVAFRIALANQSSCPASVSTGQPACGESSDVGSSAPSAGKTLHVGNPVDVASGNKYQSDIDAKLADSKLSFLRHYNSAQSNINIGMGNGWRHSYSVMLSRNGDTQLQIVQSDGRRISFDQIESVYRARHSDDGFIRELSNGRHVWHLPDGREFLFVGSFLASIIFDDEKLELRYHDTRLVSVTDSLGRSIDLEYAPGVIGLRSYSNADIDVPAGHLAAIVLPDNTRVEYLYDHQQNLMSAHFPRGTIRSRAVNYSYDDERNSALLTERTNALHVPFARWTYDDHERVSSYRSSWNIRADGSERGLPDLRFTYTEGATAGIGLTAIKDRQGRVREYEWLVGGDGEVLEIVATDSDKRDVTDITETGKGDSKDSSSLSVGVNDEDTLTIVDLDVLGYPSLVQYFHYETSRSYEFRVVYSQVGELSEITLPSEIEESLKRIGNEFQLSIDETNDSQFPHQDKLLSEVNENYELISLVRATTLAMENLTVSLERGARITSNDLDPRWKYLHEGAGHSGNIPSFKGLGSTCSSLLTNCTELLRIRDYAEIAGCAYKQSACHTRFREVNLSSMNIDPSYLHEGSFSAEIFYDSVNDEYIVTFAGTDPSSIGDWYSNIGQELGRDAFQYEKAVRLALLLRQQHPTLSFVYTGHSLGGGLATAAAGATRGQAVVFNPAGLTRAAADRIGVDYNHVQQQTNVFSVEGELLGSVQAASGLAEEPPGVISRLPRPSFPWIQSNVSGRPILTYGVRLAVALHGMDAVNQSISEALTLQQCGP